MLKALEVFFSVYGLDGDKLGSEPFFALCLGSMSLAEGVLYDVNILEIGFHSYLFLCGV